MPPCCYFLSQGDPPYVDGSLAECCVGRGATSIFLAVHARPVPVALASLPTLRDTGTSSAIIQTSFLFSLCSRQHKYTCYDCMMSTKMFKEKFWMKKYLHWVPKRTVCWSNSPMIRCLRSGKLLKKDRGGNNGVRYSRNRAGARCFQGSKQLKETQCPVSTVIT